MSKHQKSNESDRNKPANLEMGAVSFDKQKRLDSEWYEKKYPDMKFLWILESGGEVDKWLRAGASIQKDESGEQHNGETHGYKAKNRQGYVSVIGGTDHGVPVEQILLKISREQYRKLIIDPKHKRNQDIRDAMGRGIASKAKSDAELSGEAGAGGNLQTYAAQTPTGGIGFEQIAGKEGFNQIVNKG